MSSRVETILNSLRALTEPVRVQGATQSAASWAIARWASESSSDGSAIVVVCPDDDVAAALVEDIETISAEKGKEGLRICQFPGWEQSPYSPIAPSLKTRLARIATLGALARTDSALPQLIVTSIAASCQATLPKAILERHTIRVRLETSVESREALIRRLIDAGYLRADTVEDAGTFAARGDIVDVFPPTFDRPLRIELFGDQVERIREFDPESQRTSTETSGELREAVIPPAREVLINLETFSLVREKLKARADDAGVPRPIRDPVLNSVQEGMYPDHSDAWAPFAYENPGTFWDYLDPSWPVAWYDELSCNQVWDEFIAEQEKLAQEAPTSGVIAPLPMELFGWAALERSARERTRLYLDRIELGGPAASEEEPEPASPENPENKEERISARHRVAVKSNTELSRGSRHSLGDLESKFQLWKKQGFAIRIYASTQSQLERIRFLLEDRKLAVVADHPLDPGTITIRLGHLSEGFRWPAEGLVILTEDEILGAKHAHSGKKSRARSEGGSAAKNWSGLQALSDLGVGDAVVHRDHGIGIYRGLSRLDLSGAPSDFLLLEYANKDKLYLPVYRLNVVQKYNGSPESIALDRLGTPHFTKTKEKVKDAVKKLAVDLVQLYAERSVREGYRFSPRDSEYREFEGKFPFDETRDQMKAIDDTLNDMESGRIMDRLICGDVGYGKTEVAIRAAFRAVTDGKQVAVLVPTTILAQQHEQSFRSRLKDYPITIESVSRFKSAKEQKEVLEKAATGKLDVIIGTHRLLSKDVKFHDLGLIVVDEEQRFGVEHKERLKTFRVNTSVLTLTATPIPRTLHMALSGLREISIINTPPVDRMPIRTYVSRFEESLIQRAIEFELKRGGQVFFLHNRVQSIHETAKTVRELVPSANVIVAHGQMAEKELESAMMAFYEKRANVLVSTAIIESGLDVPNANTIIINRADMFGLSQLYQIRGRVGRSGSRAYAYLLIPAEGALTEDAKKRLEVIQRFVELGSGFSIASHDLEIRGGGDLLGAQQSGHIAAVGFDLYTELLEEAIRELQGRAPSAEESRKEPEIKAPFPAFLSEDYVPDVHQRLSLYRRLSAAADDPELDRLEGELQDRFGKLPDEAQNLVWLIRIKQVLKKIGIDTLTVGQGKVSLVPGDRSTLDPVRAIALVSSDREKYQLTPDSKLVAKIPTVTLRDLFFGLEGLFKDLLPRT